MVVDNYLVCYVIDPGVVTVTDVLYGASEHLAGIILAHRVFANLSLAQGLVEPYPATASCVFYTYLCVKIEKRGGMHYEHEGYIIGA